MENQRITDFLYALFDQVLEKNEDALIWPQDLLTYFDYDLIFGSFVIEILKENFGMIRIVLYDDDRNDILLFKDYDFDKDKYLIRYASENNQDFDIETFKEYWRMLNHD